MSFRPMGSFVVFGIGCFAAALHAPTSANTKLGQQLGESLTRASRQQAIRGRQDGNDVVFQDMAEHLLSDQQVLTNPRVNQVVTEANRLASSEVLPPDDVCTRSWEQPCPDGWDIFGDSKCLAPSSYAGGCGMSQQFAAATVAAKAKFASLCRAPWPCKDMCPRGHDYDVCPDGWKPIGGGVCQHHSRTDDSKCSGVFNFRDMSVSDKQAMAAVCGVVWKCKASCDQDYSALCPEGWSIVSGLCLAPATYVGECPYSVDTSQMTLVQKQSHASKCALRYPCRRAPLDMTSSARSTEMSGEVLASTASLELGRSFDGSDLGSGEPHLDDARARTSV